MPCPRHAIGKERSRDIHSDRSTKVIDRVSLEIDVNFDIPSQTSNKNNDHDESPQTSIEMVTWNDAT